jgi:LysM repeat protein
LKAQAKKDLKSAPALMEGELSHRVKKKETLFGIAHQYGVEQQVLIERNPGLASGLQEGMLVVIPVARVTNVPKEQLAPAVDDRSRSHLVLPGETLFSLSKEYGVPVEELRSANGGPAMVLKAGAYIRIPAMVEAAPPKPAGEPRPSAGDRSKVVLLLPFATELNDSTLGQKDAKAFHPVTHAAVQFYAGALMAIDSLKQLGLHAEVTVLDVGDDARTWTPALKSPAVREADLCIGPFHRQALESLSRAAPRAHIVCPVPQSNKVLLGNPNISKVVSGRPDQLQYMARYIALRHARDNIVLCTADVPAEKEQRENVQRTLNEALALRSERLRDSVVVIPSGKNTLTDLVSRLSASQLNVVVVPSENVEFVTGLVNRLAPLTKEKRIVVFGTNAWSAMEPLEARKLEELKACVPASTWIDHAAPAVEHFVAAYRERFQNEPGDYAFLGFDVTYFYLRGLMAFGSALTEHFDAVDARPLHMAFKLHKTGEENGYRNESSLLLQYQETGLRPLK